MTRPPAAQHAKLVPRTDNYPKNLDNEGAVFIPGQREHKLMPRDAGFSRKMGRHVDSATWRALTTIPDPIDAEEFRTAGVSMLHSKICPAPPPVKAGPPSMLWKLGVLTQDSKMETPVHWKDHARRAL